MKESILAIWRPNMGYRMLHSLLLKVFLGINIKRTYRLWKELCLGRVKRYRKKRTGTPVPYADTMPNDVWTMDSIHDGCMNGTKLRILSIVDEFTRECLALDVSTCINSTTVRSVLSRLFTTRAVPRFLRSDNRSEFIARSTAMLLHEAKCTARFIKPGKPWQNGFIESIHSTLRRDHLDV
jgi:putative transposase